MERREKEAVRYLGFGKNAVDDRTLALIREFFRSVRRGGVEKPGIFPGNPEKS